MAVDIASPKLKSFWDWQGAIVERFDNVKKNYFYQTTYYREFYDKLSILVENTLRFK